MVKNLFGNWKFIWLCVFQKNSYKVFLCGHIFEDLMFYFKLNQFSVSRHCTFKKENYI